jgi:hypothetical protein
MYQSIVQLFYGGFHLPLAFVARYYIVADGPYLREGNAHLQAYIEERSPLHALYLGAIQLLPMGYSRRMATHQIAGKAGSCGQVGTIAVIGMTGLQ